MKINEAIANRRKELNLTLDDVAKVVGVSKSTVMRWESGEIDNMRRDRIESLAKILQVSPLFIMGMSDGKTATSTDSLPASNLMRPAFHRVPIIGRIAAGTPILAEQNLDGYADVTDAIHADFCLEVHGDSMINAGIQDGSIVFIREQPEVEDGEIAAVVINDDTATLKRVYRHDDTLTLVAENPKYPPMILNQQTCDNFRIVGKAIAYQSLIK